MENKIFTSFYKTDRCKRIFELIDIPKAYLTREQAQEREYFLNKHKISKPIMVSYIFPTFERFLYAEDKIFISVVNISDLFELTINEGMIDFFTYFINNYPFELLFNFFNDPILDFNVTKRSIDINLDFLKVLHNKRDFYDRLSKDIFQKALMENSCDIVDYMIEFHNKEEIRDFILPGPIDAIFLSKNVFDALENIFIKFPDIFDDIPDFSIPCSKMSFMNFALKYNFLSKINISHLLNIINQEIRDFLYDHRHELKLYDYVKISNHHNILNLVDLLRDFTDHENIISKITINGNNYDTILLLIEKIRNNRFY